MSDGISGLPFGKGHEKRHPCLENTDESRRKIMPRKRPVPFKLMEAMELRGRRLSKTKGVCLRDKVEELFLQTF